MNFFEFLRRLISILPKEPKELRGLTDEQWRSFILEVVKPVAESKTELIAQSPAIGTDK